MWDGETIFENAIRMFCKKDANCEERENQQDATISCLLSTSVSTCFGHHYAHLQEIKDRVTAYATNHIQQNQRGTPYAVTRSLIS
jgi:hypothetical protein